MRIAARPQAQRLWQQSGKILEYAALLLIIFFIMLPIVWLALTSIKPQEKAYSTDIIFRPTVDNFRIIFSDTTVQINTGTERQRGEVGRNMLPNVVNSIVVSGATILIAIPLATIAAYAGRCIHIVALYLCDGLLDRTTGRGLNDQKVDHHDAE